jgi:UDP-N-acetylmuramyl pentapeptide synthase
MSYTIESISERIGAQRVGDTLATIDWLLTDSRSLCFPEETLFFALTTVRSDGARYIADLYSRGVRNFVISEATSIDTQRDSFSFDYYKDANFLIVGNVLKALQKLAELHREQFQIPVIGITGSNGKTIVKEWLHQLLSPDHDVNLSILL